MFAKEFPYRSVAVNEHLAVESVVPGAGNGNEWFGTPDLSRTALPSDR